MTGGDSTVRVRGEKIESQTVCVFHPTHRMKAQTEDRLKDAAFCGFQLLPGCQVSRNGEVGDGAGELAGTASFLRRTGRNRPVADTVLNPVRTAFPSALFVENHHAVFFRGVTDVPLTLKAPAVFEEESVAACAREIDHDVCPYLFVFRI